MIVPKISLMSSLKKVSSCRKLENEFGEVDHQSHGLSNRPSPSNPHASRVNDDSLNQITNCESGGRAPAPYRLNENRTASLSDSISLFPDHSDTLPEVDITNSGNRGQTARRESPIPSQPLAYPHLEAIVVTDNTTMQQAGETRNYEVETSSYQASQIFGQDASLSECRTLHLSGEVHVQRRYRESVEVRAEDKNTTNPFSQQVSRQSGARDSEIIPSGGVLEPTEREQYGTGMADFPSGPNTFPSRSARASITSVRILIPDAVKQALSRITPTSVATFFANKKRCWHCFQVVREGMLPEHGGGRLCVPYGSYVGGFPCIWCLFVTTTHMTLLAHYSEFHLRCPFCKLFLLVRSHRQQHVNRCHSNSIFHETS